jgi:flagellar protein FlgJ
MTIPVDPSVYTDFRGLAELRRRANVDSSDDRSGTLREVAQQFEALFVNMMLQSMRDASLANGMLDNDQSEQYQSMFDQQMALELTKGRGLGLADMLVRQLGGDVESFVNRSPATAVPLRTQPGQPPIPVPVLESADPSSSQKLADWRPATQRQFVADLWPHAQQAAKALATEPEVLLAQAALETGWGQHVIPRANGSSSHNLFGIKADPQWTGEHAVVSTIEFDRGVMRREQARFRAYDSPAASFQDYVEFLKENPRYISMLKKPHDAQAYVQALQQSGYATDPEYAAKIIGILNGGRLRRAVDAVKDSAANAVILNEEEAAMQSSAAKLENDGQLLQGGET